MTVFPRSTVDTKASCERWWCFWSSSHPSRSHCIDDARRHTRKWGHREFDFSHRLRFEGEL